MQPDIPTTAAPRQATSREFLAILFRRRWVILGLFAVTSLTVLAIAFATPVEYVSSGRVLIKRGEKESLLTPARRVLSDWEEDMGSEVEVVKSASVIERAKAILNEEAGAGRTPPRLIARNVDAEVRGRTNVILIGYVDRDPVVAKQLCDAVLRAYVEFRQNDFSLAFPTNFFEGEIDQVQKELDHRNAMRRNYAEEANVVDLQQQCASDIGRLGSLEQRRSELQSDLAEAKTSLQKLTQFNDQATIDQPNFSLYFSNETALSELKRRVVDQEYKVATLRENMRDDSPLVTAAAVTLDTLRAMMKREIASRLDGARARVEIIQSRLAVTQRDIDEIQGRLASMPDKERTLAEIDHRIDALKSRYRELSENRDRAQINEKTTPSRNVVLLARASNGVPRNARDYVRLALAPAFSIVVGIGVAFFLDGLDLTVRTAHHAEEAVDLPVLATLVERPRRRRNALEPERAAS